MEQIFYDPMPVVQSLLAGFPVLMLHLFSATMVWAIALAIYMAITPHREFNLIRKGNMAAAVSLGGAALGLAIPLAFCLSGSVNVWDIIIWGSVSLLLQLVAFRAVDYLIGDLSRRIMNDELAPSVFLAMTKLSLAALNAAAIAG